LGLTRRAYLAGSCASALLGLPELGCSDSMKWISNRIGPILIADATGDGHDDCLGWFTDFDKLRRIRLTVIDGRSGEYHYSVQSAPARNVALVGTRLLTAMDSSGERGMVLPPRIELSDLRQRTVIKRQDTPNGVTGFYVDGDSAAGRDLVGVVRQPRVDRDELLLVDIATRRVAFRYQRS
jgi:hypothetical protein